MFRARSKCTVRLASAGAAAQKEESPGLACVGGRSARLNERLKGLARTAGGMKNLLRAVFYRGGIMFGF